MMRSPRGITTLDAELGQQGLNRSANHDVETSQKWEPPANGDNSHHLGADKYPHQARLDHLDGIRALALMGVLLYHFELFRITGGFTGVDVFLVLSGFLMTRNICNAIWQDRFSLRNFYVSRFWRLYPSSVITVLLTLVVGIMILGEDMMMELRKSAVSTLFMYSNILFGSQIGGYFDGGAITKPLLHTWSLSLEEQFYACYPVFLVLFANRGKVFHLVLVLVTLISFGLAVGLVDKFPTWTWYLLPTRIYEFTIGALAFFVYELIPSSHWWHEGASAVGFISILLSYRFMSEATTFPGWASLPSTLGAALMILSPKSSLSTGVLSSEWAKWLGKVSYAAYLVHWPIWVFTMYITGSHGYGYECLIASLILGWLQCTWYETPVREHRPKAVIVLWIVSMLLVITPHGWTQNAISFGGGASIETHSSGAQVLASSASPSSLSPGPTALPSQANLSALSTEGSVAPLMVPGQSVLLHIPVVRPKQTIIHVSVPIAVSDANTSIADRYYAMHPVPPEAMKVYLRWAPLLRNEELLRGPVSWYEGNISDLATLPEHGGGPAVYTYEKNLISSDQVPDLLVSGDSFLRNIQNPLRDLTDSKNLSFLVVTDVGLLGIGYTKDELTEFATRKRDMRGVFVPAAYALNLLFENVNKPAVWLMSFRWHYTPLAHFQFNVDYNADRFEIEFPKLLALFRAKKHQMILVGPSPASKDSIRECVQRLGKIGGPRECPYWDSEEENVVYYNDAIRRLAKPFLDDTVILIDSESLFCRSDEFNQTVVKCRVRAQDNGDYLYWDGENGHLSLRGSTMYLKPLMEAYELARKRLASSNL